MYCCTLPSNSSLDGGGWSTPRPGRFTSGKDPVPIVQEAGWAAGPVWTGAENLAPTGIRSPDRPARSESLHRLSYSGPLLCYVVYNIRTKCADYDIITSKSNTPMYVTLNAVNPLGTI